MPDTKQTRAYACTTYPMLIAFCAVLAPGAAYAEQARENEEIVVTASPIAGGADRFATIVTSVDRDEILKRGGATLADALKTAPGVAGTGFAAGASRPIIRGFDANRVRVLENGLGSADVSELGPDHGVPIDPLSAESIEVVRGAATLRYGGQAIGGVVNSIDKRIPKELPATPFGGEAAVGYADNSAASQGNVLVDAAIGQFAFHADASGRRASDYDTPQGRLANSFARGSVYAGGGSFFFGDKAESRIGAGVVQYDSKYGIPAEDAFIDMTQTKGVVSGSLALDGWVEKITLDASSVDYEHSEIDPATGAALSTFKNKEDEGRIEAVLGPLGPLADSAVGVHVIDRNFSGLGEAADFILPASQRTAAIFAFTEAPLGPLLLQGAARIENTEMEGTPLSGVRVSREFTPFSAALGGSYEATNGVRLGLNFALSERAPGIEEMFARGPHEGTQTYETGDPNLEPERSVSVEATVRVRKERFAFEGAVWGARFSDYIYGELTGQLCEEDGVCGATGELQELFFKQRDANFVGAEAQASYRLAKLGGGDLEVKALADIVRARLADGGGDVPRIQPWRVGAGMDWSSQRLDAGFLLLRVGEQDRVPVGDTTTKGFVNLDAHVAWRPFGEGAEIALIGRNLTDTTQRSATAFNRDEVVQPGRSVSVLVRSRF